MTSGDAAAIDLAPLLRPRSVAVVGATERAGAYGDAVLRNLAAAGFPGPVWAINPRRDSVHGRDCVPEVAALPEPVDAVVVAIPAAGVPEVVSAVGARGCGGAIVMSSGFGETAGGRALESELHAVARAFRLPVCGPNGNGIVSVPARAPLWGDLVGEVRSGPMAIVSESGNFGVNALASRRGLGFHTVVSCGNGAVLSPSDWIDALSELDGVRSIALMLESDGDGSHLARALAHCAERGIGVAALKIGRSAAGARAAGAHTGALAGEQRVFAALLREAGAATAQEPAELLELARALAEPRARPSRRGGAAVLTCSGGDSGIAADLAHDRGLPLPELAPATRARLLRVLPPAATPANPLDYTAMLWDDREALTEIAAAMASDPGIDQLLILFDQPPGLVPVDAEDWRAVRRALVTGAASGEAAVLVGSTLPELLDPVGLDELANGGVAVAAGLGAVISAAVALRAAPGDPERLVAIAAAAEATIRTGPERAVLVGPEAANWRAPGNGSPRALGELQAKRLLREGGLAVPRAAAATGVEAAVAAARNLGGPVALKLSSPGLLHKTEAGAVTLNLGDEAAVRTAAERLLALPVAAGATLLVERMAQPGAELFFAVRCDGIVPALVVGAGGTWAELLDDVALILLPAGPARVERALLGLRAAPRWTGARGTEPVDLTEAARFGARLGELALEHDLELLEVNPARVGPDGCVALDAVARRRA